MHVRRLSLQGFKTFAARTSFEFEQGITAIVGPNGSGKSNLADALRWVLGEQSYSTLRSRRTEDVIFSGSSARPPMGLAEVSLLLDNEDGRLPLDFAEVEITRRAHRTGANEYYINRRRVRLRDVEQALGGFSSSYVVIHQGLVDEALSLRPQERRALLEEAAEVHRYHERRQKAQERLERTEANMTRISDLRHELAPRLRALERQSKQARQLAQTETALLQDLRNWYRLLWEEAHNAWSQSVHEEETTRRQLTRVRDALDSATAQATHLRQGLQQAQQQQEEQRQQEATLRQREAGLRQELAQVEGEERALRRYAQELQGEIDRWQEEATRQQERLHSIETVHRDLGQQLEQGQGELLQREQVLLQAEAELQSLRRERQQLQQELGTLSDRSQEIARRQDHLATRQESLLQEQRERATRAQELAAKIEQVVEEKVAVETRRRQQEDLLAEGQSRVEAQRAEVVAAQTRLQDINEALEQARWRLSEARARLAALTQSNTAGNGAAFLQTWAREQGRPEYVFLLSHLQIPAGLEAAVEVALGAHASALLSTDWIEARTALRTLQDAQAGHVALLAAEELHPPPPPSARHLAGEGLLLNQLSFPEEQRPAVLALLGRTLLAPNLESARQIARELSPGWIVVTRQGEAVTSEGILHGGQQPPGQSAVERERERQSLRRAVGEAEAAQEQHEQARVEARQHLVQHEATLAGLELEREQIRLAVEEQTQQDKGLERELARLNEEKNRLQQRLEESQDDGERLTKERASLQTIWEQVQASQGSLQSRLEETQRSEHRAQENHERVRDLLQEARTNWAVIHKERENQQALEEMARHNIARLDQQIAEAEQRLQEALSQQQVWAERAASLNTALGQVSQDIAATLEALPPAPATLEELARREEETSRLRQDVLDAEAAAARAGVEVQRQRDHLKEILRRGLTEIGPEASAYGPAGEAFLNALLEDPPEWARTPLDPGVTLEDLERRIAHLREQARRIGPVNPLAEEEFLQTEERYSFLGQQLQDMHDASRSLRQVIAELDQAMEERFEETFAAINREFQSYFTRLFGGGTANLRMVRLEDGGDGLAGLGVEIIARPPGKRAHNLALLSGGERALASTALLFAILKVNPRPFCFLDEVDAMLDEANVGRFRECLEELAEQTQFIVITHNRGTIEAADTLYGVSMADDGTSRVLSLRLEEVPS